MRHRDDDSLNTNVGSRQFHEKLRENRRKYHEAADPMLAELADAGFRVSTAGELKRAYTSYKRAIPILLDWLPRIDYTPLRMDVLHALATRFAKPAAGPVLIDEFRRVQDWYSKWDVGHALSYVADDTIFAEVVALVTDKRHGRGREMLAWALGKMKNPKAIDVLVTLLDDEEVAGHALRPLGTLRAHKARSRIEAFLTHPTAWVRREAKAALTKLDRDSNATS